MRKIIAVFIAVVLCVLTPGQVSAANLHDEEIIEYITETGNHVLINITNTGTDVTSKVYINGALSQMSQIDMECETISTYIYDGSCKTTVEDNASTSHVLRINEDASSDVLLTNQVSSKSNGETTEMFGEPVENTGLARGMLRSGVWYYTIGNYSGHSYAPNLSGSIHRAYTKTYDGETAYWQWGAGTTLSAVSAYISGVGGPVSFIIGMLTWSVTEQLAYAATIRLETYTFDYEYIVIVNGRDSYKPFRSITYWKVNNEAEGTSDWVYKTFNDGFVMDNWEMFRFGLENYLELYG